MPHTPVPLSFSRRMWSCVLALLAGLAAAPGATNTAPDDETVRALRRACEGELAAMADAEARRERDDGGWCASYLFGVADTLSAFGAGGHPAGLCAAHYDARALVDTFVQ